MRTLPHLALGLVVGWMAACSGNDGKRTPPKPAPPAEKQGKPDPKPTKKPTTRPKTVTTVDLWHTYRGAEKEALNQVIAAYNTSQSAIKLTVKAVPYDGFLDKLRVTIGAKRGPDLFIFAHNKLGPWTQAKMVAPLTTDVPPEVLARFEPAAVKAMVYEKSLYGLPLALKPLALFYNKALLPKVPDAMEALIPLLKRVQTKKRHGIAYDAGQLFFHAQWIHAFGGGLLDASLRPLLDHTAQVKALAFARSLHDEHKILPKGLGGYMITSLFNKGQAATVISGPWFRGEIVKGIDAGVVPIPSLGGKPARPFLSIEGVFVSSQSRVKRAALKAALHLAGDASATKRMTVGKQTVANRAVLDATRDPMVRVFRKAASQAVLMDARPEMDEVWAPMNAALAAGIFGKKQSLKALLRRAQERVVRAFHKLGK